MGDVGQDIEHTCEPDRLLMPYIDVRSMLLILAIREEGGPSALPNSLYGQANMRRPAKGKMPLFLWNFNYSLLIARPQTPFASLTSVASSSMDVEEYDVRGSGDSAPLYFYRARDHAALSRSRVPLYCTFFRPPHSTDTNINININPDASSSLSPTPPAAQDMR
jgi:hypothetical protein